MPVNVVKSPADEKRWNDAKQRAAEQGHAEDWAYVMGIYKRMKHAAEDILGEAMAYAATPAQDAWRRVSDQVLQSRGRATYEVPLVPGFENSMAQDILLLPTEEQFEDQQAAGELPHYVYDPADMRRRGEIRRTRRVITQLAKLSEALSWETSDESREGHATPQERERHVGDGVDIAWQQNAKDDPGSREAEPSGRNDILTGNYCP